MFDGYSACRLKLLSCLKLGINVYTWCFLCLAQISDGLIQLTVISSTNLSQHTSLSGDITLPWRCEALQGTVEVLHEHKIPSSGVAGRKYTHWHLFTFQLLVELLHYESDSAR